MECDEPRAVPRLACVSDGHSRVERISRTASPIARVKPSTPTTGTSYTSGGVRALHSQDEPRIRAAQMIPRTSRLTVRSIPLCSMWMSSFPSRNRRTISFNSPGRFVEQPVPVVDRPLDPPAEPLPQLPDPVLADVQVDHLGQAERRAQLPGTALQHHQGAQEHGHLGREQDAEPADDVGHPVQGGAQVELGQRHVGEVEHELVDLRPQAGRVGRRRLAQGGDRLGQPDRVPVVDGHNQGLEPVAHLLVEPADHAGVQDAEHPAGQDQVVPRVRVGVVEPVPEDHLQVDAGRPQGQLAAGRPPAPPRP